MLGTHADRSAVEDNIDSNVRRNMFDDGGSWIGFITKTRDKRKPRKRIAVAVLCSTDRIPSKERKRMKKRERERICISVNADNSRCRTKRIDQDFLFTSFDELGLLPIVFGRFLSLVTPLVLVESISRFVVTLDEASARVFTGEERTTP